MTTKNRGARRVYVQPHGTRRLTSNAQGLRPGLFWKYHEDLLSSPLDIEDRVIDIVENTEDEVASSCRFFQLSSSASICYADGPGNRAYPLCFVSCSLVFFFFFFFFCWFCRQACKLKEKIERLCSPVVLLEVSSRLHNELCKNDDTFYHGHMINVWCECSAS